MKILILKPSSLGDVVHAMPVLRMLRRALPAAEIHWWISTDLIPLLQNDPDLNGLFPFDRKNWWRPSNWPDAVRGIRLMRRQRFDWVIDLQSLARSGIFAWLANGELTVGLDDSREGARGFYDIAVRRPSFHTHAVDWYLETLRVLKVPVEWDFEWLPPHLETQSTLEKKWNLSGNRWIILNPGARWPTKRWPVGQFAELARTLARTYPNHRLAITGGTDDFNDSVAIAQAAPDRSLVIAGQTSLPELIEWLRAADFVVTNDTGPMHIAAALGKPMAGIFGPTEPRRTGPYRGLSQTIQTPLPCVPCFKSACSNSLPLECLRSVSPDGVLRLIQRQLQAA